MLRWYLFINLVSYLIDVNNEKRLKIVIDNCECKINTMYFSLFNQKHCQHIGTLVSQRIIKNIGKNDRIFNYYNNKNLDKNVNLISKFTRD